MMASGTSGNRYDNHSDDNSTLDNDLFDADDGVPPLLLFSRRSIVWVC